MDLCDALPGCPSSASVPQGNFWPGQPGGVAPMWPGQAIQPQPCWPGQPNAPCWPGIQPAPIPAPTPAPAPAPAPAPVPDPAPASSPYHPCQPCWPGPQPPQVLPPAPAPQLLPPAPTPQVLPPAPAPATGQPGVPGWPVNPSQGGWPYNPGQSGWPAQNPAFSPPQWPVQPTSGTVMVPYNLNLMRGVYDKMMMTIRGQVKPDARMFTVNFLRGNDIALHINPRFSDAGRPTLVRNSKVGERWGKEERDLQSPFPLAPGQPFEMKILCTYNEFKVAVNNSPLFEFQHRVRELNQINRINILHDIVLTYVNVDTLP